MALDSDKWQLARLFPTTGIGGPDEQERRATSALLAVMKSVNELGRVLTARCGAPVGTLETFIEVRFMGDGRAFQPDGLVRVTRGKKIWTALVEVKTAHVDLKADQIVNYLDVAREQGIDAVITISHQVEPTPGVHPVVVDGRKTKKVKLHHISWSRIHTEALIQQATKAVSDRDQAWILSEFIRYLEEPKAGALDFDDMGSSWVSIRNSAAQGTTRAGDEETLDVVSRFDQLMTFCGMKLSRRLNTHVQQRLTRRQRDDHVGRIQAQAALLARTGSLAGSLVVPHAAAPIDIVVDLRANRVDCSSSIGAPLTVRPSARVTWLLRQLANATPGLLISAVTVRSKDPGRTHTLAALREDPKQLLEDPKSDVRSFKLTLSQPAGSKRGQGKGSFVDSVTALVDRFYTDVGQYLREWSAPAPKPHNGHATNFDEKPATTEGGGGGGLSTPLDTSLETRIVNSNRDTLTEHQPPGESPPVLTISGPMDRSRDVDDGASPASHGNRTEPRTWASTSARA